MSKNQFFYERKQQIKPVEGETEPQFKIYKDSFNVNKVIRSVATDMGRVVILDDFHEEIRPVPTMNSRGVPNGTKNQKDTYQSEITLGLEDSERFVKFMENEG